MFETKNKTCLEVITLGLERLRHFEDANTCGVKTGFVFKLYYKLSAFCAFYLTCLVTEDEK